MGYHRDATSTLSQTPGAGNPSAEATPSQIQGVLNPGGGLARQAGGVAKAGPVVTSSGPESDTAAVVDEDGTMVRQRMRPAGSPVLMGRSSRSYLDGTVNPGNVKNPYGTIPDHSEIVAWYARTWVRAEGAVQAVGAGFLAYGATLTIACPPLSAFLAFLAGDNANSAYNKMSTGERSDSMLKTIVRESLHKPLGYDDRQSDRLAEVTDAAINLGAGWYAGVIASRAAAAAAESAEAASSISIAAPAATKATAAENSVTLITPKTLATTAQGTPMDPARFQRIKGAFERQKSADGGFKIIDQSSEAQYELFEASKNFAQTGLTRSADEVLMVPNPTASTVFEELIHTSRFRRGLVEEPIAKYGLDRGFTYLEIQVQEKLLRNARPYALTAEEVASMRKRLVGLRKTFEAGR